MGSVHDDGVNIEAVADDDAYQHPDVLENTSPTFIIDYMEFVASYLQSYGWILVLGVLVLLCFKDKIISLFKANKRESDEVNRKKFDLSADNDQQEKMLAARMKLQEEHDLKAQLYKEEQAKLAEKRRLERIEDWDRHQQGKGYRSKYKIEDDQLEKKDAKPKKLLPRDRMYRDEGCSPLGGPSGGGSTYRPPRNRGGMGGG